MVFLVAKALHIVAFISWFAGLFYIVRLFVYFEEAGQHEANKSEILRDQLGLMQRRLWTIITRPAMIVTYLAGFTMVYTRYSFSNLPPWLWIKFGFLLVLFVYHLQCGKILREQAQQRCTWNSRQLRIFNEGATMLMVAIVCLAVFKSGLSAVWGLGLWIALGIVLMLAVKMYRKRLAAQSQAQKGTESKVDHPSPAKV